jgi:drug/metabolite transporter (DMT)-like permease
VFKDGFSSFTDTNSDALSTITGDLLALGAAFSWAIYAVVLRKLNVTYSAKFVTRKTFFYGLITALPFWAISSEPISPMSNLLSVEVIVNLLFLGMLCSVLAYTIWSGVMNTLGAITTNNYLYVQPICTMIIAAILFDNDPITFMGCFGAALIIGGLWFGDMMNHRAVKRS